MAVEVCCEIASLVVSPRISFSHDDGIPLECHQQQQQQHHYRSDAFLLESSSTIDFDFDFCVSEKQLFISSADELFSNGKILPFEIKNSTPLTQITNKSLQKQPKSFSQLQKQPLLENDKENTKKKSLKEFLS